MKSFPVHEPFKLHYASAFQVLSKEHVEPLSPFPTVLDPPDADHAFSVKVMLLATPALDALYAKTCLLAENGNFEVSM